MRWKQFFTPVKSIDADGARSILADKQGEEVTILDVRQPSEYEKGHIPGAKLIPLPDLPQRLDEIQADKPAVVYCAMGGRSRVAAQMLSGKGFKDVYNLTGGFNGWSGEAAYGGEEMGLALFTGAESPEETLVTAYSLEEGLREFYLLMEKKTTNDDAGKLFRHLSEIEIKHQDRIFAEYIEITGKTIERGAFEESIVSEAMEGGMTTEEYVNHFSPAPESVSSIVEIAMSIEAQALDLYSRAAGRTDAPENKRVLSRIADEERTHLALLGQLMDKIHSAGS